MSTLPLTPDPVLQPAVLEHDELLFAAVEFNSMTLADLGSAYRRGGAALDAAVAAGHVSAPGPLTGIYLGDPQSVFAMSVAYPVSSRVEPFTVDELTVTSFPIASGRFAVLSHLGSYDGLGASWARLAEFAANRALMTEPWLEVHVTGAVSGDERTDLLMPVS